MPRSNIAVDKQLAQRLTGVAEAENKPVYALTNEIIKTGLDLIENKVDINDLPLTIKIINMMKDLDVVPVPGNLMELMIKSLYLSDREQLMQIGFKSGEDLGNYLSTFYKSIVELIANFKDSLVQIFPIKRLELEASSVNPEKIVYTLRAVGVGRSKETSEFVKEVVKGVLSVYREVRIIDILTNNGLLEVEFQIYPDNQNRITGSNLQEPDFSF